MKSLHWFRYWLGALRHQAITWANVVPDLSHQMASLGHNESSSISRFQNNFLALLQWLGTYKFFDLHDFIIINLAFFKTDHIIIYDLDTIYWNSPCLTGSFYLPTSFRQRDISSPISLSISEHLLSIQHSLNSLCPSYTVWWSRSWSTLV